MATVVENEFPALSVGEPIACDRFVRDEYAALFRWFLWLTNCPHRAADLTQETFAAFWGSLRRTTPDTSPRTWLYGIGRNLWRKDCRNRHAHQTDGEAALDQVTDAVVSPSDAAEHREFAEALEAEVAKLPADLGEVFSLRLMQDFEYADIASVQGISPELARWRFFRARQIIRSRLKAWSLPEDSDGK